MQQKLLLEPDSQLDSTAATANGPEPALNVVVIYQDHLTHHWAMDLWARVEQLIGSGGISSKSWRVNDLAHPDALAAAGRAAMRADVLIVSLRDAAELPLSLYLWVDEWLPHRLTRTSALVALIAVPVQPDAQSGLTRRFLESVARKAGMDFLPRERKLPEEPFALPVLAKVEPLAAWAGVLPGAGLHRAMRE
ncbi:MAG TPA: hypothetical protein P5205_16825 [Candidatus Paceibacterota bacterium]|nr:hypothetical protein [Verrucomicrobiota bacterium]HSA12027.1 hypothetical protein [Candidatus Paceibacterota bacterium]